jgi:mono/diheme cytochrome c family protein
VIFHLRIALQRESILWHNGAGGEHMAMIFSFAEGAAHRRTATTGRFALPVIGVIFLLAAAGLPAQNAAPPAEKGEAAHAANAESGKKIFTKDGCYECHGHEGQGAVPAAGPRIGPPRLSLEAFTKYVHEPTGQMPPYTSKVISDEELADIYAYLQTRPKPMPLKDIPLLNQ